MQVDSHSQLLLKYKRVYACLMDAAESNIAAHRLERGGFILKAAIDLAQTHFHGLVEDRRLNYLIRDLAQREFGPRVELQANSKIRTVGFFIRHFLDVRGVGKSIFYLADYLRETGWRPIFFLLEPPSNSESDLARRVCEADLPVRHLTTEQCPLSRARQLKKMLHDEDVTVVFNYDYGDSLCGLLALLGGASPKVINHQLTDHLLSCNIHDFECHLAHRRAPFAYCGSAFNEKTCRMLPLPGSIVFGSTPQGQVSRSDLGVPEDAPVLLAVTSLLKLTGDDLWFRCLDEVLVSCPNAHFVIVGGGDSASKNWANEQILSMRSKSRVHAIGSRRDVPAILPTADVFIDSHPIGGITACLEAMAAGIPIVTLSEGRAVLFGTEEFVQLPECIATSQAEFISKVLVFLTDSTIAADTGSKLKQIYERQFNPAAVVDRYHRLALEIVEAPLNEGSGRLSESRDWNEYQEVQLANAAERAHGEYWIDAMAGYPALGLHAVWHESRILLRPRFWRTVASGLLKPK
ncbi:MAG: glycosyltransferase [Verrucomicrobiota bacterium]|nr:glycosyltransferase [Verrucomicrobiota bacterium]